MERSAWLIKDLRLASRQTREMALYSPNPSSDDPEHLFHTSGPLLAILAGPGQRLEDGLHGAPMSEGRVTSLPIHLQSGDKQRLQSRP